MAFTTADKQMLIELLKEASAALEDLPTCRQPLPDELHRMAALLNEEPDISSAGVTVSEETLGYLEHLDEGFDNLIRNTRDKYNRGYTESMQKELKQVLSVMSAEKAPAETPAATPATALSDDAMEALVGMVDYCLNNGIAMGQDEGFSSFEPEIKHPFRQELEAFCKNPKGFEFGHAEANEDLKAAINHATAFLSLHGNSTSPRAVKVMKEFLDASEATNEPIRLAVHLE